MKKIAIIGSGISGLGSAYMLSHQADITLFEKNNYAGGHSRTIDARIPKSGATAPDKAVPVDTGFIVFNNWNYPHLLAFFEKIGVPYQKSDMSFGVSLAGNNKQRGWLEYSSNCLLGIKNIIRPAYWGMLYDIIRFNRAAKKAHAEGKLGTEISLDQFIKDQDMGEWFERYYVLAMGAAIWSCPIETILKFPAATFIHFFKNHGLLNIKNRPQWYTVTGGSREYVGRIKEQLGDRLNLNCGAQSVTENQTGGYDVTDAKGDTNHFDDVIFACHADEALALINQPTKDEQDILGAFDYQDNKVVTHADESFMPENKKCWASWIYLNNGERDKKPVVSLSYWMNNLQGLDTDTPILVTLNPGRAPAKDKIIDTHHFSHPIFDQKAIDAQAKIPEMQGKRGLWFCGAYQRYGFHEDGLFSAVKMVREMGYDVPWTAKDSS
jgi:predicted NAD/FAD-binding protein